MSYTLSQLVQRTVTRLSMVPGVAVQVYAEDRIAEMIWHKFTTVRDMLWWDDFMEWQELTQGADGRPIENIVRQMPIAPAGDEIVINEYKDIQHAWHPNRMDPLKTLPKRTNPRGAMREGSTLYRVPDQSKVIRFLPIESGLRMMVRYRRYYDYFQPDDIVPMDDQVIILGACYDYLEDDGTNPGQTEKFRNMYNDRLGQLIRMENDEEIPITPQPYTNAGGWTTIV